MTFPTFTDFFEATHHHQRPYEWQARLASKVRNEGWPAHIAIPTGMGKTTTIAIAVYELARQLSEGSERSAPQRIFHVVDRRSIVDQTSTYIENLASAINDCGQSDPILTPVRDALRTMCGPGDDHAIVATHLHGGVIDDRKWYRVAGCTIVSLTSYQFVSRLLMRGFGVSESTRPIAGSLCALDRIVLFDEPHLSTQSVSTIRDAEELQGSLTPTLGIPQARLTLLGATVPRHLTDEIDRQQPAFEFDLSAEKATGTFQGRFNAQRRVTATWSGKNTDLEYKQEIVKQTRQFWSEGKTRVVVFANTVSLAQSIYKELTNKPKSSRPNVQLVTSRFRAADRDNQLLNNGTVIATQCLEVGVDITFEALVTEACPWQPFVQRLGRLNRDGALKEAPAVFVGSWNVETSSPETRSGTKVVYGQTTAAMQQFLHERLALLGEMDVGTAGMRAISKDPNFPLADLEGEPIRVGTLHSLMLPALAQTRPTPRPDIPLQSLISGPDEPVNQDIAIAWRSNLEVLDLMGNNTTVFPEEFVTVTRNALSNFIAGKSPLNTLSDVEFTTQRKQEKKSVIPIGLDRLRVWDPYEECWKQPAEHAEVLSAQQVVLGCDVGGYSQELGWTGSLTNKPVSDVSLIAALKTVTNTPADALTIIVTRESLQSWCEYEYSTADSGEDSLGQLLLSVPTIEDEESYRKEIEVRTRNLFCPFLGENITVNALVDPTMPNTLPSVEIRVPPRTPGSSKSRSTPTVTLEAHQNQVGSWALQDATRAGLTSELADQIGTAGFLHDEGKRREEFQKLLRFPDPVDLNEPLAKSLSVTPTWNAAHAIRQQVGLEDGWRHEIETVHSMANRHGNDGLVRHLIGSHHGWYRPFFPPLSRTGHDQPIQHADEFAELNNRYGIWGLAYLETILRLADWRASKNPDELTPIPVDSSVWKREDPRTSLTPVRPTTELRGSSSVIPLPGLSSQLLTGWYTSVALLASAYESGDHSATLHWTSWHDGADVTIPTLTTLCALPDLIQNIIANDEWSTTGELTASNELLKFKNDANALCVQNQTLGPARNLRRLLKNAEENDNRLVLGMVGDLTAVRLLEESNNLVVPMPITAFANNSSFPAVAFEVVSQDITTLIATIMNSCHDVNAGFENEKRDGGIDRSRKLQPAVNGLGGKAELRQTRKTLAPLILFGMTRYGAGPVKGMGRDGNVLTLPLPTRPTSFRELQALTIMGVGPDTMNHLWALSGQEMVLTNTISNMGKSDNGWVSTPTPRGKL